MRSSRTASFRALSVLALALVGVVLVAGISPGATTPLTKQKAKKLFYTKAKADAKFIDSDEAKVTVRTHDAHVILPSASNTPVTVVSVPDLPPGKYLLSGKAVAVNFGAADFIRCRMMIGTTQLDASSATLGSAGGGDAADPVGVLPLQGGFESTAPFAVVLECFHEPGTIGGIYLENSTLAASRVGSLSVAAG